MSGTLGWLGGAIVGRTGEAVGRTVAFGEGSGKAGFSVWSTFTTGTSSVDSLNNRRNNDRPLRSGLSSLMLLTTFELCLVALILTISERYWPNLSSVVVGRRGGALPLVHSSRLAASN